jgi:ribosomal protein L11 methyltransferase
LTEYLEINLELVSRQESEQEIVLALLADFGFEGFREEEGRIFAYIETDIFRSVDFESFLDRYGDKINSYNTKQIPNRNWNEEWEKSYSPVEILDNCLVRAPFHNPREGIEYDLVISPKMSFGTAHHETTQLMLEEILQRSWGKKKLLDLGCGTGVLAILADHMGANEVFALDNDQGACQNALENIKLNNCRNIKVSCGELESLKDSGFSAILANINLNVLLREMENISSILLNDGIAIISGFYKKELHQISATAQSNSMELIGHRTLNRWTVAVYRKGD